MLIQDEKREAVRLFCAEINKKDMAGTEHFQAAFLNLIAQTDKDFGIICLHMLLKSNCEKQAEFEKITRGLQALLQTDLSFSARTFIENCLKSTP